MSRYSKRSLEVLAELHVDLQTLFKAVIQYVDIKLICGHRGRVAQHQAFTELRSKVDWPNSKHNVSPALAVDIMPCPDGKAIDYVYLGGIIMAIAYALFMEGKMTHRVRYGAEWNGNMRISDEKFLDCGHYELVTKP